MDKNDNNYDYNNQKNKKTFVIRYGGSLFSPNKDEIIDLDLFLNFIELLKKFRSTHKFFVIMGGGFIAQEYQNYLRKVDSSDYDLDIIGIWAIKLNAQFCRLVINRKGLNDFIEIIDVVDSEGTNHSSNYNAASIAKDNNASTVLNLSNIYYIYSSNPNIDKNAKKLENITWDEYLKLIPEEWSPKLSVPFDPEASRLAKENNISVIFTKGDDLENIENIILGKDFKGSVIHNQHTIFQSISQTRHP